MARFKIAWVTVLFAVVAACSSNSPTASNGGSSGASGSTNATGGTGAAGGFGGAAGASGGVGGLSGGTCDAGAPLTVTSNHTPDTTVGASYSYSYQATGGCPPYTWTVTSGSLPPGLSLSQDGTISGSATTVGTYTFTVKCCDSAGTCTSNDRGINVTAGNGSGGSGGSGGTGASGGSAGAGATGGSAGMGTLSGCTVNASNQPVCGSGVGSAAVPSGWALAQAEGFEGDKLADPSVETLHNQGSQWGTNIECTHAHTGSCAISAPYVADDMQGIWDLAAGALGSSTEIDVSWWEDESSGATHQDGGDFNLASVLDPTGNAHMWMDWFGQPNPPDGKGCLNGVGPSGDYNCQNGQLDLATNFNGTMQSQDQDYYGAMLNQNYNIWRQYEWHFKANTPGSSDGEVQLYVNGQLLLHYANITLNRTVSMVGMEVQIGGVYTAYKNSSNSAGTDCVKPSGTYLFPCQPFSACSPCPIPPNFTRYWDDIIVLKK